MALDLAYDVGRVACRLREGALSCTREVLTIGPWDVPLRDITNVRTSPRLRFIEVSTHTGTRRFYASMDPGSREDFDLLGLFLQRAVSVARRAHPRPTLPGGFVEEPERRLPMATAVGESGAKATERSPPGKGFRRAAARPPAGGRTTPRPPAQRRGR